jgi:SAM-dependent methyltransferase
VALDPDIEAHYAAGVEADRLEGWSLERLRTEELLGRFLPAPPARLADVGGGPGRYAVWLAERGYDVHLIDPVELHVSQARAMAAGRFTAEQGDARRLPLGDRSCDAVVLMGPLYHLVEPADRATALREAVRVCRPAGVVVAAAISAAASLLDGLRAGMLGDPDFRRVVEGDLASGQHRNPDPVGRPEWFTTAYLHRPGDLSAELSAAGLLDVAVVGVEGPAWLVTAAGRSPLDDAEGALQLWAARQAERLPDLTSVSAHLLAVGRIPA